MASRLEAVLHAHLPEYRIDSLVPLGEGLEHVAYEVNGELVVRFSKDSDPRQLTAEARLLAAVAEVSPLPVPELRFTAPESGCLAYRKLPGVPLLHVDREQRAPHGPAIAAQLGELLTALHAVPVGRVSDLVGPDDQPLEQWRQEAADLAATVAALVPAPHRRAVEAFLDAPPPPAGYATVFSHNDLGIEHVLVDPLMWTITGIIDWSDAAIVDPAYDFGLVYRDLGPAGLHAALEHYRTDANDITALRERAVFYARCSVFEDLAYGRDRYVDNGRNAMGWLF